MPTGCDPMKSCKKCRKEIASNARVCPQCGYRYTHPFVKMLAWGFAGLFGIGLISSMIGSSGNVTPQKPNTSTGNTTRPATFDEAAAAIKSCGRPISDRPQELNAGGGSEGRSLVFGRYKTELWFYRGPGSKQWMLFAAFPEGGDNVLDIAVVHSRMPCTKALDYHISGDRLTAAKQREKEQQDTAEKRMKDAHWQAAELGAMTLRKAMRNPDSFQLSQVLLMPDGSVCYDYRAQNGFGGMNREYAVLRASGQLTANENGLWNRECAHKTGEDGTAAINVALNGLKALF